MHTTADARTLQSSLGTSELVPLLKNPVDVVWGSERPSRPKSPVFALDVKYAGVAASCLLSSPRLDLH